MVCQSCCEISIKLHKYRTNAIANDQLLKEKCSTNTNHFIQPEPNPLSTKNVVNLFNLTLSKELTTQLETFKNIPDSYVRTLEPIKKPAPKIIYHPSIKRLINDNPQVIVPKEIFSEDVLPVVTLDHGEVTSWYEEQICKVKQKLGNITVKRLTVNPDPEPKKSLLNGENTKSTPIKMTIGRCPADRDKKKIVRQGPSLSKTGINPSVSKTGITSSLSKTGITPSRKIENGLKISVPNTNVKVIKVSEIVNKLNLENNYVKANSTVTNNDISTLLRNLVLKTTGTIKMNKKERRESLIPEVKSPREQHQSTLKLTNNDTSHTATVNPTKIKSVARKRTSFMKSDTQKNVIENTAVPKKKVCVRSSKTAPTATSTTLKSKEVKRNNITSRQDSALNSIPIDSSSSLKEKITKDDNKKKDRLMSSSPPENDSLFIINSKKSLKVFVCPVCSLVCESRKKLKHHQKTHLFCTTCRKKFKTLDCLEAHRKEHCVISQIKDEAQVKLVRVDDIPSVVQKYSEAFQIDDSDGDDNHFDDNTLQYYDYQIKCENDTMFEVEPDNNAGNIIITEVMSENIVCISDDSDNDVVELSVVPDEVDVTNKSFYFISKQYLNENDMKSSLYKKHFMGNKVTTNTQTFKPLPTVIKGSSSSIIVLENMFSELLCYRIPVQLECQPKICARFDTSEPAKETTPSEYWGHKKTIDAHKVGASAETNGTLNNSTNVQAEVTNNPPSPIIDVVSDSNALVPITMPSVNSTVVTNGTVLPLTSSLAELLSDTYSSTQTTSQNIPNINSILNQSFPITSSQIISLAPSEILPSNNIIVNSNSNPNLALSNVPQMNNIILLSNQIQPSVVNNIVCNANFTIPLNTLTTSDDDVTQQNKIQEIQ